MNTERNVERTQQGLQDLPELSAESIDRIEDALFADIGKDRSARRARRGRLWLAGGSAAAVVAVAVVIAPMVGGVVGGAGGFSSDAVAPAMGPAGGSDMVKLEEGAEALTADQSAGGADSSLQAPGEADVAGRAIITTASTSLVVDDTGEAAGQVGEIAAGFGGYVESMNVGSSGSVVPMDPNSGIVYDTSSPYPYPQDGAWVTVRVPSEDLVAAMTEVSALGDVTSSSVNRQDVTDQKVDLEARIAAAEASVARLTELMAQAGDVGDLIAAETALSDRQAQLESYQQQLESLDGMVEMSTLSVTLSPEIVAVEADPAGFGDGLAAGWNGLVATLNGIVIALGFLLPWVGVALVLGLIVWGIVRLARRARRAAAASATESAEKAEAGGERFSED